MKTLLRPAVSLFILLSLILGGLYPALVTGLGQTFFPQQANGSLVERKGVVVGSSLIGQNFTGANYFWGRISASGTFPYNGMASGGSNFGPLNPALADAAKARAEELRAGQAGGKGEIPLDLLTSSGSGLDPHISPAGAEYQVERVAQARGMTVEQVRAIVLSQTEAPQWGLFGEPRVNVLGVNLALDGAAK